MENPFQKTRPLSIRQVFDRYHKRYPNAYIAIQSGDFVCFLFKQALELSRIMGEPLNQETSCSNLSIHKLAFEDFVARLHHVVKVPVVWVERLQDGGGFVGIRVVKTFTIDATPSNSD